MRICNSLKLLSILFIVLTGVFANASEDFSEDVALLKSALEELHPGYKRYLDEETLEKRWTQLLAQSTDTSALSFYTNVSDLLSDLRCEHTKAELPKRFEEQKKDNMLPFTVKIFENKMYINKTSLDVAPGTEILSVNQVPVAQILEKIRRLVAIDGFTDHTIDTKIEQDTDLVGSNLEEFLAPAGLGLSEYPATYQLEIVENGSVRNVMINTINFEQWQKMTEIKYRINFKDSVFLELQDKVAILTVDTFVNYRQPVDAMEKFDETFAQLKEANIEHLIVDLRNNGGGSDDAQLALMRHLINQPFKVNDAAWVANKNISNWKDKISTWDDIVFHPLLPWVSSDDEYGRKIPGMFMGDNYSTQKPAKNVFKGRITVLTSKNNASASAGLLSHFQQQPNMTLVGEPTGGNQGGVTASIIGFLFLPQSGITVRVPFIRNRYALENPKDGYGVDPDVAIEMTKQDWLENRDAALEYAILN